MDPFSQSISCQKETGLLPDLDPIRGVTITIRSVFAGILTAISLLKDNDVIICLLSNSDQKTYGKSTITGIA